MKGIRLRWWGPRGRQNSPLPAGCCCRVTCHSLVGRDTVLKGLIDHEILGLGLRGLGGGAPRRPWRQLGGLLRRLAAALRPLRPWRRGGAAAACVLGGLGGSVRGGLLLGGLGGSVSGGLVLCGLGGSGGFSGRNLLGCQDRFGGLALGASSPSPSVAVAGRATAARMRAADVMPANQLVADTALGAEELPLGCEHCSS